ncbi:MAG TPA: HAD-IIB family hydrolase, partial [Candidatus Limnocylindrales bacterium]|nr:HAD-IIB family hydrolase [Candidatus Limnocylindrales bacterium]
DDRLYIGEENEYSRYYQSLARIDLEPVGDLVNFLKQCQADPSKLSIICWDGRLNEIETYLKSHFNGEISVLQSRPYFLEITDRHATKGQALHWLAEREGIKPEEIIAFGDGHNDIDMLRYAGLGVAVANAHSEVLEAADFVTLSNMEDGVAEVIEKYVLGQ